LKIGIEDVRAEVDSNSTKHINVVQQGRETP
jgi:hypothetical protein